MLMQIDLIMRELFFFSLSFSILFQSYFSYKSIDINTITIEKKQKFEFEKVDQTKVKGRLVSIDEEKIILKNKGNSQTVLKAEIRDVRVKKFSILKSSGVVTFAALLVGLFATSIVPVANPGG